MKVYVASSWRNVHQEHVVAELRAVGHEVYDFKNPEPGNNGFHWSDVDPDWERWDAPTFRGCLEHPIAVDGFNRDMDALKWADAVVLLQPCGRSAHLELGYAVGAGKFTVALIRNGQEPELMYRMVDVLACSMAEVLAALHEREAVAV